MKKIIWVILLSLLLIGGGSWLYFKYQKKGFIVALVPIDKERAAVIIRMNHMNNPAQAWLGVFGRKKGFLWIRELPEVPRTVAPYGAMTVSRDVITIRSIRDYYEKVAKKYVSAYAVKDGKPLWRSKPVLWHSWEVKGVGQIRAQDLLYTLSNADRDQIFSFFQLGRDPKHPKLNDSISLRSYESKSGKLLWKKNVGKFHLRKVHLTKAHMLYQKDASNWSILNRKNGKLFAKIKYSGQPCLLNDRNVWMFHPNKGALAVLDLKGDGKQKFFPATKELSDVKLGWYPLSCGVYKKQLIFVLESYDLKVGFKLASFSFDTGKLNWLKNVPFWKMRRIHGTANKYPQTKPFSGKLTRFLPLIVNEFKKSYRLVQFDFEKAKFVRVGKPQRSLLYPTFFRHTDSFFLSRAGRAPLISINGSTGNLSGLYYKGFLGEVKPYHMKDGRIWLYETSIYPFHKLPIKVIEAKTLKDLPVSKSHAMTKVQNDVLKTKKKVGWYKQQRQNASTPTTKRVNQRLP